MYMFALGPPTSLTMPAKPGFLRNDAISERMDSGLLLWMTDPWCIEMAQKLQFP
ncbi:MAG: hypothetical protein BWY05_01536 [Euryarchaeota archaeon ADurb.Bin165]|nr:MAG: hypothetical protein BWY05_01536 [Euryarchaeota archaeon ADurb.Bin165]